MFVLCQIQIFSRSTLNVIPSLASIGMYATPNADAGVRTPPPFRPTLHSSRRSKHNAAADSIRDVAKYPGYKWLSPKKKCFVLFTSPLPSTRQTTRASPQNAMNFDRKKPCSRCCFDGPSPGFGRTNRSNNQNVGENIIPNTNFSLSLVFSLLIKRIESKQFSPTACQ